MSQVLVNFINDAYRAGKTHDEVYAVLVKAGWPEDELKACFDKFSDEPFPVPVPKPTVYASPRLTALNLFYFVVLYVTIYSAISIIFTFLDYHLPDGLGRKAGLYYSTRPIGDAIRGSLAAILVAAPLVWWVQRTLQRIMKVGQSVPVMRLRLLNLTLFIAAIIMLCNFITFVYYFLSGELGIRFVIKVLVLSGVCFGLYHYFKPEVRANEQKA